MRHFHGALLSIISLAGAVPHAVAFNLSDTLASILTPDNIAKHYLEFIGLGCIALYIIIGLIGVSQNKRIASTWLSLLGEADGVLARNFAVYGGVDGNGQEKLWWKESADIYKCYASGRRYCTGALISLNLKARQDVFSQLWYLLSPREDILELDVFMSESAMPQTVLLLGQPKLVKVLLKNDEGKIGKFAKLLQVSKDRVPGGWSNERVAVAAEAPAVFYDIMNAEPALAKGLSLRWLRTGLASSEVAPGSNPLQPRISFTFALPPLNKVEELHTLLSCVFLLVDLLGSYKVSPEMKKRAAELRAQLQLEEVKKSSQDRQEQLQQKKMERLEAERAKARAAGPAALAKFEEKLQQKYRNKELRKRMIRA